jgi:two-component system phosphate regulon sensor histidine kinase PhoR
MPLQLEDRKRYFAVSVSPLRERSREIYGALVVFHDVTELKLAEQMRMDFVANVSHELRTPLTAIKGYADTLVEDLAAGRAVDGRFLSTIQRNADRLMDLIQDLLDLNTLESGRDQLQLDWVNTRELTEAVLRQLDGQFIAKKQVVELSVDAEKVWADRSRLEQILVNLLVNASKYTPTQSRVSVMWDAGKKQDVLLRVHDNGPGIDPIHHDRLFERFFRVDQARSRDLGGTGLGLAIVKHIMTRHGGVVWVSSEVGKGAQFTCQFPLPQVERY